MNLMQEKIIATLRGAVEQTEAQWLENSNRDCEGTVYIQRPASFETLMKLEYEFDRYECRLLMYRAGVHAGGRCGIRYDDGAALEKALLQFESILSHALAQPIVGRIDLPPRDRRLSRCEARLRGSRRILYPALDGEVETAA